LTQAMSWFARPEDDLSHVLVSEQFETDRNFYFPLPHEPEHKGIIDFVILPFVRMSGLLPPLLKKEQTYSERVKLSEVYLNDKSNRTGQITLDLEKHTLSVDGYKWAQLQPLSAGLYLFLLEHANLAKQQTEFHFKQSFDYRYKLSQCLNRTELKQPADKNKKKSGLSSLVYQEEKKWAFCWKKLGGNDQIESRKYDLDNAFGKLHTDLKDIGDVSFQVIKGREKPKRASRCVDIAPERIQIIEKFRDS